MTPPEKDREHFQDPGYELVKEQSLFKKELTERVHWFIHLRWLAAGGTIAGSWVAYIVEPVFPAVALTAVALFIFLYNGFFLYVWRRLESPPHREVESYNIFAHAQIGLDLLTLYVMIYFTGGVYSPLLLFAIFHVILAGILLSPTSCYFYGILVIAATGVLIALEDSGILPPQPILFQSPAFPYLLPISRAVLDMVTLLAFFAAAVLITVFLTTSVKLSLRKKGLDLLRVSKELDASNAKLKALYALIKKMGSCSDLKALMDMATRNAAGIMGVKGSSIKLLDEHRKKLLFASTYGLSENYLAKGAIDIDKSPINREIIQGSPFSKGKIQEGDYYQYPEDIRKEGIASMLCLPLRVEKMVLGVFCVYSDMSYYFSESDVEFFSLMVDLTAVAIEALRVELNKTWFLQKAAHQLRSPFSTIYSMLKTISKGYLGPVNEKQEETIKRCEKRLEGLGTLINDLLKLGVKRMNVDRAGIRPVDARKVMSGLSGLFQTDASEKGVRIAFNIEEGLSRMMADEKLVNDLFSNLIFNAIKYTPKGGEVNVSLTGEGPNKILFEVSDTGIGIPEEDIPRLFTEFFRAENAKAVTEEGTGLGLVIVKEILDFLGGTITVESKVGEGTTFRCLLPSA